MSNINPTTEGLPFERVFLIDVSKLNNGAGVTAASTTALMSLAGIRVLGTETEIVTPSAAAMLTFDVGDGTTATRFQSNTDAKAVAGTIVASTIAAAPFGSASTANLTITWDHTATSGVFLLRVYGFERRPVPLKSV